MAEQRKDRRGAAKGQGESPVGGSSSTGGSPAAAKPKRGKIAKRAGGHVVYVDPPTEAKPVGQCSIHGLPLVNGKCPEEHESRRGWAIEKS